MLTYQIRNKHIFSAFDNTTLLECNNRNDCLVPKASKCNRMANPTPSGKIGYCVPYKCESDEDCVTIGNVCTSGSLSGKCWFFKDMDHMTCKYEPVLQIATCGKK